MRRCLIDFEHVGMCRDCHQWIRLGPYNGQVTEHHWRNRPCRGSGRAPMQRDRCHMKDAPDV